MPWAIPIVGSVVGGAIAASGAKGAAKTQAAAADRATELQKEMYDQTRADQAPWRDAGLNALNRMNALLGLPQVSGQAQNALSPGQDGAPQIRDYNALRSALLPQYTTFGGPGGMPNYYDSTGGDPRGGGGGVNEAALKAAIEAEMAKDQTAYNQWSQQQGSVQSPGQQAISPMNALQLDPGYQFRLGEGNKAIERAASSRGGLYSGATLKALQRYSQDFASNEFGNVFSRNATVAGFGPAAANATGNAGMNYANQAGSNAIGAGNAQAAAGIAQGNIWGNALNQGIATWGRGSAAPFRMDDPYRSPSYFGGDEGE